MARMHPDGIEGNWRREKSFPVYKEIRISEKNEKKTNPDKQAKGHAIAPGEASE